MKLLVVLRKQMQRLSMFDCFEITNFRPAQIESSVNMEISSALARLPLRLKSLVCTKIKFIFKNYFNPF